MYYYIKNNKLYQFDFELNPNKYKVGYTYEESNNKWVKLSDKQVEFYLNNKGASLLSIWNMKLPPVYQTREEFKNIYDEKNKMIQKIQYYAMSLNLFLIDNNQHILSDYNRANLLNSTNSELNLGITESVLWLDNVKYNIFTEGLLNMLQQLEVYSKQCSNITQQHINNIQNSDDIDYVMNYDFTPDYPEILSFNLNDLNNKDNYEVSEKEIMEFFGNLNDDEISEDEMFNFFNTVL